jgi:LytS/YehU family sensor histidine kinase
MKYPEYRREAHLLNLNNHRHLQKLMIHTFVENSIRHGLVYKKENCYLEVRIEDMRDFTKIFIIDKGIGRKAAAKLSWESTRKEISILQDFIKAYNKIQDKEFLMEIIDLFAD